MFCIHVSVCNNLSSAPASSGKSPGLNRYAPSTGTGTGTPQGVLADLQVTPIQGRTFEVVFTYKY